MIPIDDVIRTRRRTLAIIVEDDGRLVVRAPMRLAARLIDEFVSSKQKWIAAKQEQARMKATRASPRRFVSGEQFLFLGESFRLEIKPDQARPLIFNGGFSLSSAALPRARTVFERWYRRQALRVISERVDRLAAEHGFEHHGVRVTAARKQWGSCGPRGNLRFAWRLVMAPPAIIDYVVVHELVHLRYRNHSKRFWGKVKSVLPDFRQREAWLEENDYLLRWE
jgi:hypothetical protein